MKQIYTLLLVLISVSASAQNSWQDDTKIADSLQSLSQFEATLAFREKAILNAEIMQKDTVQYLKLLRDISKNEVLIDKKDKIFEGYTNLQSLSKKLSTYHSQPERIYKLYNSLYEFANQLDSLKASDYYISKSLEFHYKNKLIDSSSLLNTLQKAGTTYRNIGKLNESVKMFKDAEVLSQKLGIEDANRLGFIYLSLAEVYRYRFLDNSKNYIKYLKKAQFVYEEANATDDIIRVYMGLSDFESGRGDFNQSVNYLKKIIRLYEKDVIEAKKLGIDKRNIEKEIKFHNYLIAAYSAMGNEELLLNHLDKILLLAKTEKLNDNIKDLVSLSYIYVVKYYDDIDTDKALVTLNEGSKFFPTEDLYKIKEEYDMQRALLYMDQQKYDEAQAIFQSLSKKTGLPLFITKTALQKTIILNIKGGNDKTAYKGVNDLLKGYFNGSESVDIKTLDYDAFEPNTVLSDTGRLLDLALAFETAPKKNTAIAETLYWLALKQFQSNFNKEILSKEIDALYSKICFYFYDKASKGELGIDKQHKFIAFTENIESKYLLNTFLNNRMDSGISEIDDLVNEEQLIRSNITFLKKNTVAKNSDSINQLIFDENLKLGKIDEQLKNSPNRIVNLITAKNPLETIKDKHIIKYKVIDSTLFRVVFYKGNIEVSEIEDYKMISLKVEQMLRHLKDLNVAPEAITQNARYLYQKLLTGIDVAEASSTLYIIPDGVLHYLPFEILMHDNEFLLETTTISYASALSFLGHISTKNNDKQKQNIALFAPSYSAFAPSTTQLAVRGEPYNLKGTLKEVESISKLFADSDLYINESASKASFKNMSNNYSILHLSMHSFINDQDSELSSLVFSDSDLDYELYISELYGLNLNADMAVLSACNTGVGQLKTGKGIISMTTAFTAAGVPSVLSSLWSAPDEATEKIMTSFYGHLKKGETKNTALKNAKLDYLKNTDDPNLKHPYYWAGFVLTGDTSAIVTATNYWWYISVVLVLVGLLFLILKRRLSFKQ